MFVFDVLRSEFEAPNLKVQNNETQKQVVERYLGDAMDALRNWGYDVSKLQFAIQERSGKLSVSISSFLPSSGELTEITAGPFEVSKSLFEVNLDVQTPSEINGNVGKISLVFGAPFQEDRTLTITMTPQSDPQNFEPQDLRTYEKKAGSNSSSASMETKFYNPELKKQPDAVYFYVEKIKQPEVQAEKSSSKTNSEELDKQLFNEKNILGIFKK